MPAGPRAGRYTLLIDPDATPDSPQGSGYAAVRITPRGDAGFPGGFAVERGAVLARYMPPARGALALALPAGADNRRIVLENGGFASLDQTFTLSPPAEIELSGANSAGLKLRLDPRTGVFRGTYTPPATGKVKPFSGAIVQEALDGSGYFLGEGPTEAGAVDLLPANRVR